MASLTLDKVTKVYRPRGRDQVVAVNQVDLEVGDGEIVGLLGSSGCGKTSTLRMIAGFESVSEGAIRCDGRPIHGLPPARRDVAMAFEGYALYPPLRVRDNIGFALLRGRRPRAEVDARVEAMARLLDISDILDRYPTTISAGQQQRTSLARALIRRAPLSLLDEPMSQLEPQLRAILRARIKEYLIENRMTTIFVTHDQTEAIALADRIAVMEQGVLQQFAGPAELKERPANLFVASFIGEPPMNVVDATLIDEAGRRSLEINNPKGTPAFRIPLAGWPMTALAHGVIQIGGAYALGIRPHRLRVGSSAAGGLAARVFSNQWLGDQTHLGLDLAGCLFVAVTEDVVAAEIGAELPVELPLDALHLFDRQNGVALRHGLDVEPKAA
ncbi:MAG: multiple sugar transport system ATP-binding protein [Rhodospirillaceae bacterium]|nr:multiple sugar transport system ATP-binding protein [Rhodospirillaceae bacterium]